VLFGLGTFFFGAAIFPVMRLFLHPKNRFQRYARPVLSAIMRVFVFILRGAGLLEMDVDDPAAYRRFSSKIVAPNHPSLLDVALLFSLIPNADCIVRGNLRRNIVYGVISQLYITTSLDPRELARACVASLNQGNCLIIFPEGTRTPRSGELTLKRGVARIALLSGCGVIPVHIGGTDKYGLGKHDPLFSYNPREKYVYRFRMQPEISPAKYAGIENPLAARRLTAELKEILFHPVNT
jgi:1-acyl-sn-glycerol-3-phosphate acyltransferase